MRFPFTFYRAGPAEFVVKYVAGVRHTEGKGVVCFVGPRTTLACVPTADLAVAIEFIELTSDGQEVIVHGEARIQLAPHSVVDRFDFSIDPWSGDYLADENPEDQLRESVRNVLRGKVRSEVRTKDLKVAITSAAALEEALRRGLTEDAKEFAELGVTVLTIFVSGIAPANADLKRALEAEARERMLASADRALADRRMDASKNDRSLKEYEADTARQLEERRKALVEARNANVVAEAEADAAAIAKRLSPYATADPRIVLALGLRELANGHVSQVTITPDLLAAVTRSAATNGARS
ncbi:MAG: SPFH domain-containing protein [Candidatus Uhrbacteria bacterium]